MKEKTKLTRTLLLVKKREFEASYTLWLRQNGFIEPHETATFPALSPHIESMQISHEDWDSWMKLAKDEPHLVSLLQEFQKNHSRGIPRRRFESYGFGNLTYQLRELGIIVKIRADEKGPKRFRLYKFRKLLTAG